MARKSINYGHGDDTRNNLNHNFKELYDESAKYSTIRREADSVIKEAKRVNNKNVDVQDQIDELILSEGESDAEVIQARGGLPLLKDRLENQDETIVMAQRYANISLEDLWQPKNQPNIHSHFKGGDAFEMHIYQEWLDFYEDLYSEFGGYITKATKPNIYEGRYEYPIYTFTPENGYSKTLILGSGMHGGEKMMVINLYKFLYHLCNDWRNDAHLSYIRNNIRLVVIPFENPFGMAYTTRKENDGTGVLTDINRNFDYKWEESSATDPNSGDYKGTAPFSTKGATYIKEVLEQYSDAEAYIDFHNKSDVTIGAGYAVTSYTPEILPFESDYFKKLNDAITPKGEDYEILNFDEPSGFNYAVNRFKMHSFNPEFTPGHMFNAYSSNEMTYSLKWLGNIIIRFALLNNRPGSLIDKSKFEQEAFVRANSMNRTTANAYPISTGNGISQSNYEHVVQLNNVFYPPSRGYIKVTYNVTYASDDPTALIYFTPKIFQTGNTSGDFSSQTAFSRFIEKFEVYNKTSSDRGQMTFQAFIPVESDAQKGHVRSEIYAYVTYGIASVLKFKTFAEFVPTNNPRNVEFIVI